MAEPVAFRYRAFISYSHVDTAWAKWLHRGLEAFRIDKDLAGRETATGTIPNSLRPVFRDRDDFSAGHSLNDQTLAALDASHALIAICSPASAKSDYVTEEIRLFKSRHADRPVIPLIVGGKPGDPERECFPASLRFKLDAKGRVTKKNVEVLAADAREEGDGKHLALAKVVAGLLGVSSDDIFRRAERERRAVLRRRRRIQALVTVLTLSLFTAGFGWWKQDDLRDRYYWAAMGPSLLTAEQEAALLPGDEFKECEGCPVMVVVPAGRFMMGSPQEIGEEVERPQHAVEILNAFAVSKYEVTFDDWNLCVDYGDCNPRISISGWGYGRQPATPVAWDDAKRYVAWLSRMTGRVYRLLSEAEWEYAARAETQTAYWWGDEVGKDNANCKGCGEEKKSLTMHIASTPVGSFAPNVFGLYDMHGNVWEWVEDTFQYDYEGAPSDGSPWVREGTKFRTRVLRGGHWDDDPSKIRSASRSPQKPETAYIGDGFRVARTLAIGATLSQPSARPPVKVLPGTSLRLAGIYRLNATDHSGNKHPGMLVVTYTGTFFALSRWTKGQVSYGTGRLDGDQLVVSWGTTGRLDGDQLVVSWGTTGPAVAVYVLGAKGALGGRWADGTVAETAELVALASERLAPPPEGTYRVEGYNSDGSRYDGVASISKKETGYYVRWEVGSSVYEGDGVLKQNVFTVKYGGSTPAIYALADNGQLIGLWNSGKGGETLIPVR